jgi:hypothetical protein
MNINFCSELYFRPFIIGTVLEHFRYLCLFAVFRIRKISNRLLGIGDLALYFVIIIVLIFSLMCSGD